MPSNMLGNTFIERAMQNPRDFVSFIRLLAITKITDVDPLLNAQFAMDTDSAVVHAGKNSLAFRVLNTQAKVIEVLLFNDANPVVAFDSEGGFDKIMVKLMKSVEKHADECQDIIDQLRQHEKMMVESRNTKSPFRELKDIPYKDIGKQQDTLPAEIGNSFLLMAVQVGIRGVLVNCYLKGEEGTTSSAAKFLSINMAEWSSSAFFQVDRRRMQNALNWLSSSISEFNTDIKAEALSQLNISNPGFEVAWF